MTDTREHARRAAEEIGGGVLGPRDFPYTSASVGIAIGIIQRHIEEALREARECILAIVDSDEFYDMLPGNGEDDRICGWLEKQIRLALPPPPQESGKEK